jgi:hypothetical protein
MNVDNFLKITIFFFFFIVSTDKYVLFFSSSFVHPLTPASILCVFGSQHHELSMLANVHRKFNRSKIFTHHNHYSNANIFDKRQNCFI